MRTMNMGISQRPKALIAVFALVFVAIAATAVTPGKAWADVGGYKDVPADAVASNVGPGFQWVEPDGDNPGYYKIYVEEALADSSLEVTGWYRFAQASKKFDFDDYLIRLADDLDFASMEWDQYGSDNDAFTVGSEDVEFAGTFDGQNHTLKNFDNHRTGLQLQVNCGFFGYTNKAVIKNLNIRDAYVGSTYSGAVVVGSAQDTFLLNISCINCTSSIVPGNPVLSLITNAGLMGGMIAGQTNGSTLYNCEMIGGRVVTNTTTGVEAVGGQPVYVGALVGAAQDTVIEYCRVDDSDEDDGGDVEMTHPSVKNSYTVSTSVLSFSEVFTGGIVGMIQGEDTGTKIVDCYSVADVRGEAGIYFGVGLGLGASRAYTGGIVGMVRGGGKGENVIQRVSYAGDLSSYVRNIFLLGIPIEENDKYMGGITGRGGDNATIDQAYYKRSESETDEKILAVRTSILENGGYESGATFGSPGDEKYTDRAYWEGCDFDMAGGKIRDLGNAYTFTTQVADTSWGQDWSTSHYNKWVMDYTRGIPIHGGSIKATLDFPGAGSVTIGATSLAGNYNPETTTDPYDFAVQGYKQGDQQIDITFTKTENDKTDLGTNGDERNEGYRFEDWYRSRDVRVNEIPENHDLFTEPNSTLNTTEDGLISDTYQVPRAEGESLSEKLVVNAPDTEVLDDEQDGKVAPEHADNDLYLVHAQANVLLHDVDGGLINKNGESQSDVAESDWYNYEDSFKLPTTIEAATSDDDLAGATFIGWTSVPNSAQKNTGYSVIDSGTLSELKAKGKFWEPGDTFTVTEPANLYPVYSRYNNIEVIYEGHDEDDLDRRSGYGQAIKSTEDGVVLTVQPKQADDGTDSPLVDGTVRFLGWYEYVGDISDIDDMEAAVKKADQDTNASNWVRVSRGEALDVDENTGETVAPVHDEDYFAYNLTEAGVDLTETHIYKARFEYRVDYMYYPEGDTDAQWKPFAQKWEYYGSQFDSITGPTYRRNPFLHWVEYTGGSYPEGVYQCDGNDEEYSNDYIDAPVVVMAHNQQRLGSTQNIIVTTDFPTGPAVKGEHRDSDFQYLVSIEEDDLVDVDNPNGTHWFYGWTGDNNGSTNWKDTNKSTVWNPGLTSTHSVGDYWYEAHVTAKVTFHNVRQIDDQGAITYAAKEVQRTYEQSVYLNEKVDNKYTWHYQSGESDLQSTSEAFAFDTDMTREGYIFLGWIDASDSDVKLVLDADHIMNGTIDDADEAYLAKSYDAVSAYLMTGSETCTRPMDLYPVYIEDFDVETTTNIAESGVDSATYNIPGDPGVADGKIVENGSTVSLNYNNDSHALIEGADCPVTITHSAGKAKLSITVATDVKLWADGKAPEGSENDTYTFESLSVLDEDGNEVDKFLASEAAGENKDTFTYEIKAGEHYTFRANYSPVPVEVIYHLGDDTDEVERYSREVGDRVPSTNSRPDFDAYDHSDAATWFFVGWTTGDPNGTPVVYRDVDDPKLITSSDTVTGTMHLWPVYRSGNVKVQTNIVDQENQHVSVTKHDMDADGLWIEVKEVDGYLFIGWTAVQSGYPMSSEAGEKFETFESGEGNIIDTSRSHRLSGDERFDGTTYTAIYRSMSSIPKVQYHDFDGSVLYTAYAMDEDADRTFYREVKVPEVDENGNIVYDPDGNISYSEETTGTPIDTEAFMLIGESLNAKNEAHAEEEDGAYEEFIGWRWVSNNSSPQRWGAYSKTDKANFVNQKVKDNAKQEEDYTMHLFPVTVQFKATDAGGAVTDITPALTLSDDGQKLESVDVMLTANNEREWLKVNLSECEYQTPETTATIGLPDIPVDLYDARSSVEHPLASATTVDENSGLNDPDGKELVKGDALFTFDGHLTITKTVDGELSAQDGQVFTFTVTDSENNKHRVPVKVTAQKDDDGAITGYTGTAEVTLPYGSYTVTEDTGWSWRYDATLSTTNTEDGQLATGAEVEVKVTYNGIGADGAPKPATVDCDNKKTNNSWNDDVAYKHNVFGDKTQGGGE